MLQVRNKGLYTAPNEFSSVPDGAMFTANNVIITADNIVEPRRGNNRAYTLPLTSDRISRFAVYQDTLIANWSNGKVGYLSGSAFTAVSSTYSHPNANTARLRFLNTNSNLYFTSSAGIYVMDAYNATPALSGIPRGLDLQLTATGATGYAANNQQYAYRVLWGIRDAQNNVKKGSPSGRAVFINASGGTRDVTVRFTIPSGITTSYFFQVYRSKASGGVAVEPDDELGLIYENNPVAGDITNSYYEFTDSTTDDLRGETIYTAPSLEGIVQSSERPPQADYIEEFQNSVIYANCKSKHRKIFTILACGGASGIANNDTVTIAGTVYTAKTAGETITSGFFYLVTGGSAAQNIADTAASLVRVINRYASNTLVSAQYISNPDELPGKILIEERGLGGSTFYLLASAHGTAFNPVLPTSGTTVASSNDDLQNQIMISKVGEGEAVPLGNTRRVGSANTGIIGVAKLRNSLFLFKEREGIYRVTGTEPDNYQVDLFDSSAKLIAPDSIAVVNNQIWCLCDQGITIVTETGVSVVSRPIEDLILDQFGGALTQAKYYSFGAGYETERQYMLWTVSTSADTTATQAFIFNTFTQAYTRWPLAKTAAIVNPVDDKLYLGDATSYYTEQERKSRTYTDYIDYGVANTITSSSSKTVYLSSIENVEVGDLLYQSATVQSVITAVEPAYVTVLDEVSWTAAACTVYKGINCEVEYTAITGENPGAVKVFPEISLLFRAARFSSATVAFATDASGYFENVTIEGNRNGLWGLFPWGSAPWGGTATTLPIRTFVPLEKQRGSLLRVKFTHRQGYGYFKLYGFSLPIRDTGSFTIAK